MDCYNHMHKEPSTLKEMLEWVQCQEDNLKRNLEWRFWHRYESVKDGETTKYDCLGITNLVTAVKQLRSKLLTSNTSTGVFKACNCDQFYCDFESTLCTIIPKLATQLATLKWLVKSSVEESCYSVTTAWLTKEILCSDFIPKGFTKSELASYKKNEMDCYLWKAFDAAESLLPFCFTLRPWAPSTIGDALGWLHGFLSNAGLKEDGDGYNTEMERKIQERFGGTSNIENGELSAFTEQLLYLYGMSDSTGLKKIAKPVCEKAYGEKCFVKRHYDVYISDLKTVAEAFVSGIRKLIVTEEQCDFRQWIHDDKLAVSCLYKNGFKPLNESNVVPQTLYNELHSCLAALRTPKYGEKEFLVLSSKGTYKPDPRLTWSKPVNPTPKPQKPTTYPTTYPTTHPITPRRPPLDYYDTYGHGYEHIYEHGYGHGHGYGRGRGYEGRKPDTSIVVREKRDEGFGWYSFMLLGALVGTTICVVIGAGLYLMKSHNDVRVLPVAEVPK